MASEGLVPREAYDRAVAERDDAVKALGVLVRRDLGSIGPVFALSEIVLACANIGYNLRCGACAELFFTGACINTHDALCTTRQEIRA